MLTLCYVMQGWVSCKSSLGRHRSCKHRLLQTRIGCCFFSNHIWTAITTGSYDPYSALVLCMLMENKDVRTKLAQDAKVTVSPTPTLLLDFIVRYIASFSILAPATSTSEGGGNMNTGGPSSPTAVLHCKILYRLILTWVHDCPVAAAMTKVDSF
eukprot:PhF_6_TR5682/c0_g2_i1/m.8377